MIGFMSVKRGPAWVEKIPQSCDCRMKIIKNQTRSALRDLSRSIEKSFIYMLLSRSSMSQIAFHKLINYNAQQDHYAKNGKFQVSGDTKHIDRIINKSNDCSRNDNTYNITTPSA